MKVYYQEKNYKIINGNCLDVLKKCPDNKFDTIITDPPYGLSFMGKKWDYDVPSIEIWKECLRVLKPGGTALMFAGSRTQHRMAVNVEDAGFILKDCIMWVYGSGFPKATDISKQLDKGCKRKIVGKRNDGVGNTDASIHKSEGLAKSRSKEYFITEPFLPEAKLWNGWKSHGLKPSYEPILVAMKPNDGTYANNALKHGVSGLNIDGGRIPLLKNEDTKRVKGGHKSSYIRRRVEKNFDIQFQGDRDKGRFPANIILDEEAAKMLDKQSGILKPQGNRLGKTLNGKRGCFGGGIINDNNNYKDIGGASRFFYCAKASKSERNIGCENIHPCQVNDGRNKLPDNAYQRGKTFRNNHHPTVKPLKLMEYLCVLTKTPTGGVVLDPFMGSGTTLMACKKTGRKSVGIELNEEYCEIAKCRLKAIE